MPARPPDHHDIMLDFRAAGGARTGRLRHGQCGAGALRAILHEPTRCEDPRPSPPVLPDSSAPTLPRACALGHEVVGCDNFNDDYDPALKRARVAALLAPCGVNCEVVDVADGAAALR